VGEHTCDLGLYVTTRRGCDQPGLLPGGAPDVPELAAFCVFGGPSGSRTLTTGTTNNAFPVATSITAVVRVKRSSRPACEAGGPCGCLPRVYVVDGYLVIRALRGVFSTAYSHSEHNLRHFVHLTFHCI
jgi:hypothetical protein